ncbi:MAG: Bax inhibitor-1/YccA family protein [Eubacteriaceae bacterium]|nr:Bax inhibitor-1/YccA family protein [Eubacteriaceae bacterium]
MYENNPMALDEEELLSYRSEYMRKVFYWMFGGVFITFAVAYLAASGNGFYNILEAFPSFPIVLMVAQLLAVVVLSAGIRRLSLSWARFLFLAYSAMTGLTFSVFFIVYEASSLVLVFALTSVFFLAMAVYGSITKTDLSTLRPVLLGGLICLCVFGILSLFIDLSPFEKIACILGSALFMLLTAFDIQRVTSYFDIYSSDPYMLEKAAVYGALTLYLDFINIFIKFLRLFGKSRRD